MKKLLITVLLAAPLLAQAQSCRSAVDQLLQRVQAENRYYWVPMTCLSFYVEQCDRAGAHIAVREVHDKVCGGDPETAPVIDRFQVLRKTGTIRVYNILTDKYE
jgi:uncharacterized protein YdhG (YjbR/CyaY superfamily)